MDFSHKYEKYKIKYKSGLTKMKGGKPLEYNPINGKLIESYDKDDFQVVAFYYPGDPISPYWDQHCNAEFLGNFYYSPIEITDGYGNDPTQFLNAESAFQALKFWTKRNSFINTSGPQAFTTKRTLEKEIKSDYTFSGYGSNLIAMKHILEIKFKDPILMAALKATGNAFLLEHNPIQGRDQIWSDNSDGTGSNALGLILMIIRDGQESTFSSVFDLLTGNDKIGLYKDDNNPDVKTWKHQVDTAAKLVINKARLTPVQKSSSSLHTAELNYLVCSISGCNKQTYFRHPGYCGRDHANKAHNLILKCSIPGCGIKTYDGNTGYCRMEHKRLGDLIIQKNAQVTSSLSWPLAEQTFPPPVPSMLSPIEQTFPPLVPSMLSHIEQTFSPQVSSMLPPIEQTFNKCILPECDKQAYNNEEGNFCSIDHLNIFKNTSKLYCLYPGCLRHKYPGGRCCGNTHRKKMDKSMCLNPDCQKNVYSDPISKIPSYCCSYSCLNEAKERGLLCSINRCYEVVYNGMIFAKCVKHLN